MISSLSLTAFRLQSRKEEEEEEHAEPMDNLEHNQISAISRLFSPRVIQELARKGRSPLFARLAKEVVDQTPSENKSVSDFFNSAFNVLKRTKHRHEYIYKSALTQRVLMGKHSLKTASMLTEFRVGSSKADVVILNGTSTVYEIKSERDSLSRLEQQIENYKTFFASIYIIAGENHINAIKSLVPEDIGVLRLSERHQITTLREAINNPSRTSPVSIFESVRRDEAEKILHLMGVPSPKVSNIEKHKALMHQFSELDSSETHHAMVQVLKETRSMQCISSFVAQLPESIRTAALTSRLNKIGQSQLLVAMDTPLSKALMWG